MFFFLLLFQNWLRFMAWGPCKRYGGTVSYKKLCLHMSALLWWVVLKLSWFQDPSCKYGCNVRGIIHLGYSEK